MECHKLYYFILLIVRKGILGIFYVGLLVIKTTFPMSYPAEILVVVMFLQCVKL